MRRAVEQCVSLQRLSHKRCTAHTSTGPAYVCQAGLCGPGATHRPLHTCIAVPLAVLSNCPVHVCSVVEAVELLPHAV